MIRLLMVIFAVVFTMTAHSLDINSFSAAGVIEWKSQFTNGIVTIERNCNLNGSGEWTEVGRFLVSNLICNASIPMCDSEAYYRLSYYTVSLEPTRPRINSSHLSPTQLSQIPPSGSETKPILRAPEMAPELPIEISQSKPVEDLVIIKAPGDDNFVLLEEARRKIVVHWRMIYPTPLVFTNQPGSQSDLQDLANALEYLSGKFYRVQ